MEGMYSKLHDKYTKLKSQKEAETDSINLDQEVKFMDYKAGRQEPGSLFNGKILDFLVNSQSSICAADELIEHLRNEYLRIRSENIDLKREMASIRSSGADKHREPKGNLNVNNVRVEDLQNEGFHHNSGNDKIENIKSVMSGSTGVESDSIDILNSISKRKRHRGSKPVEFDAIGILKSNSTRKYPRYHRTAEEAITRSDNGLAPECDSTNHELRQFDLLGTGSHILQPACCRTQDVSGNTVNVDSACNCVFQDLIEHLLGMKLSAAVQADGICISALHQSSDYSFKLTLVEKVSGGELGLVYDPISLGAFEMGAPEWMKEVIIFSMLMSPIFFERVLRVIK